jgi:hypothetical protein
MNVILCSFHGHEISGELNPHARGGLSVVEILKMVCLTSMLLFII